MQQPSHQTADQTVLEMQEAVQSLKRQFRTKRAQLSDLRNQSANAEQEVQLLMCELLLEFEDWCAFPGL